MGPAETLKLWTHNAKIENGDSDGNIFSFPFDLVVILKIEPEPQYSTIHSLKPELHQA